jgi:hypothetical protein
MPTVCLLAFPLVWTWLPACLPAGAVEQDLSGFRMEPSRDLSAAASAAAAGAAASGASGSQPSQPALASPSITATATDDTIDTIDSRRSSVVPSAAIGALPSTVVAEAVGGASMEEAQRQHEVEALRKVRGAGLGGLVGELSLHWTARCVTSDVFSVRLRPYINLASLFETHNLPAGS